MSDNRHFFNYWSTKENQEQYLNTSLHVHSSSGNERISQKIKEIHLNIDIQLSVFNGIACFEINENSKMYKNLE